LPLADYCVTGLHDVVGANDLFWKHGFVGVYNACSTEFASRLGSACVEVAEAQIKHNIGAIDDARNHWSYKPQFGGDNSTFVEMLFLPGIHELLKGMGLSGYVPAKIGGEFTLAHYECRQDLHSDFTSACPFKKSWALPKHKDLPIHGHFPPVLAVSFVPSDMESFQAPLRAVPWDNCNWGIVDKCVEDSDVAFFACPGGTMIIRDVRVPHSGTENLTSNARYQPGFLLVSPAYLHSGASPADCWRPVRSIPLRIWESALDIHLPAARCGINIDFLCAWPTSHENAIHAETRWCAIKSFVQVFKELRTVRQLAKRFNVDTVNYATFALDLIGINSS
jgi:hypothetical protein